MFLEYYHLNEQPFGVSPDPGYIYFGPTHREALASLAYAVESGSGFAALVARPGMGKTTLLFRLLDHLKSKARTGFLFQTQCNSADLLRYILADMGVKTSSNDPVEMHTQLNEVLLREARLGRHTVVAIDEAQNLDLRVLETIRLLSDFETPRRKLLQVILSGQPALAEKLARPEMAQLRQRITVLCRLTPLSPQDTGRYIDHRLGVAGYNGDTLFTTEALNLIARESQGIPRVINTICFNALSIGRALERCRIDSDIIREVLKDLSVDSLLEEMKAEPAGVTPKAMAPAPSSSALLSGSGAEETYDAPLTHALATTLAATALEAMAPASASASASAVSPSASGTEETCDAPLAQALATTLAKTAPVPTATASASAVSPSGCQNKVMQRVPPERAVAPALLLEPAKTSSAPQVAAAHHFYTSLAPRRRSWRWLARMGVGAVGTLLLWIALRADHSVMNSYSAWTGRSHAASPVEPPVYPAAPVHVDPPNGAAGGISPGAATPVETHPDEIAPLVHVVQPNETLGGISVQYLGHYDFGLLADVQRLNSDVKDPDRILAGQKILLPPAADSVDGNISGNNTSGSGLPSKEKQ
jgi:general secretion pathway protein A